MFRRGRRDGAKWFTRNVAGQTVSNLSAPFVPPNTFIQDSGILIPGALAGIGPLHLVKQIIVSHWSWSEDIAASGVDPDVARFYQATGTSAFYVDQIQEDGTPVHAGDGFLNQLGVTATVDLDTFPLRIVHRRRFTLVVNMQDAVPPGGFGGTGNTLTSAAGITPGFGTERSIKRRIRLKPNEGLFWRVELYDLITTGTTNSLELASDIIGAVSFKVDT